MKKGPGEYVSMRAIAPTLHYDFRLVVEKSGALESFGAFRTETQFVGGSKSPAFPKRALAALEQVVPGARRVELPGLDHAASWNIDRGSDPAPGSAGIARLLRLMALVGMATRAER